jgi:leader peptidase (prepilin peptidase)/N-methyltransferase
MLGAVLIVGALGALVGSFLNVVIHRVPRGESVVTPRSRCPACGAEIRARDNVPVLGWLVLRGRCRSCRARISARYPLVEAATAAAFAGCAAVQGVDRDLVLELPFVAMLVAVAAIDLDLRIVPNRILAPAAAFAVLAALVLRPSDLPELLGAGAVAFVLLLGAALARPGGMGMGDVKLAGVMGLYLGAAVAPALLVAFLAGSLVGLVVVARLGMAGRKVAVPFAPFLAAGGLVGLLVGHELVELYMERFL